MTDLQRGQVKAGYVTIISRSNLTHVTNKVACHNSAAATLRRKDHKCAYKISLSTRETYTPLYLVLVHNKKKIKWQKREKGKLEDHSVTGQCGVQNNKIDGCCHVWLNPNHTHLRNNLWLAEMHFLWQRRGENRIRAADCFKKQKWKAVFFFQWNISWVTSEPRRLTNTEVKGRRQKWIHLKSVVRLAGSWKPRLSGHRTPNQN